jgi:stage III sporulation protein AH
MQKMVKRQTVWLSTMMVLSLMLIGYYTMSNQTSTTSGDAGASGPTVSTSTAEPGSVQSPSSTSAGGSSTSPSGTSQNQTAGSSGQTNKAQTSSSTTTAPSATAAAASSDDWFVSQETHLDQQMSEQISNLQQVIANNNASTDTISKAEQSLQNLENLKGNIAEARDAIVGDGFKECVIVPTAANAQMHVYVKSDKLAASDVVKIMNIVSQQLEIPMTSVIVTSHA